MKKLSRLLGTVLLLLSCSTFAMADLVSLPPPEDGEGRYAFTWKGELEGLADPYDKFNGLKFTLSGFYFDNGIFDFTQLEMPDPLLGGGGSLVALPPPEGCGPGCLALPDPDAGGPGNIISLIPRIEITIPESGPPAARFLSLDFNGIAASVETYSFKAEPVPEPSTLCLMGAGLAGLVAVRRKIKS